MQNKLESLEKDEIRCVFIGWESSDVYRYSTCDSSFLSKSLGIIIAVSAHHHANEMADLFSDSLAGG